jgi:hypothetical protein
MSHWMLAEALEKVIMISVCCTVPSPDIEALTPVEKLGLAFNLAGTVALYLGRDLDDTSEGEAAS